MTEAVRSSFDTVRAQIDEAVTGRDPETIAQSAGCLIPPFEYHTLTNARDDRSSITLHVYGGEMDHCHIFEPAGHGAFRRVTKALSYHE